MTSNAQPQNLDQDQAFSNTFENNWTQPEFNKNIGEYVIYNYWKGNIYTEIVKHN